MNSTMISATRKLAAALAAMMAATSLLAETAEVGGMTYDYTICSGKATITKATGENKVIIVPDTLGGAAVTTIGTSAFKDNTFVQKIVLPESVTTINNKFNTGGAFQGCNMLSSINIPSRVTSIPDYCFYGCAKLRKIELPNGIQGIGIAAFYGCSSLTAVAIPNSVTSIGAGAFRNCSSLTAVTIPDGVTSIGDTAFQGCSGLTAVTIPDSVTSIGTWAFYNCSALTSVTIPDSVTSIEGSAFYKVKRVVFLGRPPAGLANASLSLVSYPREYGELWAAQIPLSMFGGFVKPDKPTVEIISSAVRANDPTVLDVVYKVTSAKPTVKVRALAFEDGVRSLGKVTRPETFIDGTAANLGDNVAANVEHTLSWRVSADFHTDLAKMVLEVFAVEDGILPLELTKIPANGSNRAMELSWNVLSEAQIFDALLWLYADGDSGLTLVSGTLKNGSTTLASGNTLYKANKKVSGTTVYYYPANAYVFGKMGFAELTGDALTYANSLTRLGLSPGTASSDALRQYAYRWIDAE